MASSGSAYQQLSSSEQRQHLRYHKAIFLLMATKVPSSCSQLLVMRADTSSESFTMTVILSVYSAGKSKGSAGTATPGSFSAADHIGYLERKGEIVSLSLGHQQALAEMAAQCKNSPRSKRIKRKGLRPHSPTPSADPRRFS